MTAMAVRMGRVTWHQHRWAVMAILGVFGVAAVLLLAEGAATRSWLAAAGLTRCFGEGVDCRLGSQAALNQFMGGADGQAVFFAGDTVHLLLAVPPAAALFAGLPWLTREFETGSFRYTWVQGISPVRWLLGVFGSLAAVAAVAAALCGVVFNWWYRFAQWPANITPARGWDWDAFGLSPIALVGWTVFAMALATLFAALLRRTVPAMAAFAVTYAGCLLFGLYWFRAWLLSLFPAVTRQNGLFVTGPANQVDYFVTTWTTGAGGHVLTEQQEVAASIAAYRHADPGQWIAAQHYVAWLSYQPHSRLAFFQLALTLVLLVLSALLVLAAVRLTRWGTRRSLRISIGAMTSSKPCALT
jgi:hypothetical protein